MENDEFRDDHEKIEVTGDGRYDRRYHYGSVWVGAAFVLLGVIFILQTLHIIALDNWWALFILIPAVGSFAGAVRNFRRNGNRFTRSVSGSIGGGLFFTAITLLFLFNADWGRWWPIFIVLAGVSILLGAFARRRGTRIS